MNSFAAVNTYCNVQKLLKTITQNPTSSLPAAATRIGGGFILEIPDVYLKMKNSDNCFDVARFAAKIFSVAFDYYIS